MYPRILGGSSASPTVSVSASYGVPLPSAFVAVTSNVVGVSKVSVGVPAITPVSVSKVRPSGRLGEMVKDTASPSLRVGLLVTIGAPTTYAAVGAVYARIVGGSNLSTIVISTVAVSDPPVLLAVTVTVFFVSTSTSAGVPVMIPVTGSKVSPWGKAVPPVISNFVASPPLGLSAGLLASISTPFTYAGADITYGASTLNLGGGSVASIGITSAVYVPSPAAFVAVTVNSVAWSKGSSGFPAMTPVSSSKVRPLGRGGEIVNDSASPPLRAGRISSGILVPFT